MAAGRMAAWLAVAGVCTELCVSANLLTLLGVPYVSEGGALPLKLHPGTYLLLAACLAACASGQAARSTDSRLLAFFAAIGGCLAWLGLMTGAGNMIVLLDTFLPAGCLAVALAGARAGTQAALRRAMQILLCGNALLALGETVVQATLIPLYLNDAAYRPVMQDFRPTALFDHPLTGALMMMIGLALAPAGRWRLPYQMLIWAALVAFGGRMALGVAVLTAGWQMASQGSRLVLSRDGRAAWAMLAAGCALAGFVAVGSVALGGVALAGGLGGRLAGHLYWDQSAQVRLAQWAIIGRLDAWQLLFGTARTDLLAMLNTLRLGSGVAVIENFWLLMFVSLGALGFPLFLAGLWALLAWCWRNTGRQGRALLVGLLVVASSSNSLGRKSTVLVCLVAATASIPAGQAVPRGRRAMPQGAAMWHPA